MQPVSNIVYETQYLIICSILDVPGTKTILRHQKPLPVGQLRFPLLVYKYLYDKSKMSKILPIVSDRLHRQRAIHMLAITLLLCGLGCLDSVEMAMREATATFPDHA